MLAREAVADATVPGLIGEMGRARPDFAGEPIALMGDCGSVRELCDLGERTLDGSTLRDGPLLARACAVDVAAMPFAALARFLGMSKSPCAFSLSDCPAISELDHCVSGGSK